MKVMASQGTMTHSSMRQTPPLTIGLFDFVPKQEQRDFQNYLKSQFSLWKKFPGKE